MTVETKYNIGNLISIRGSTEVWRIVALHVSSYSKNVSVFYDVQSENGRRSMTQETRVEKLIS